MRADEFLEATFGTSPKRKPRTGARPPRGHTPVPRYHSKGSEQGSVGEPTNRPDNARSVLESAPAGMVRFVLDSERAYQAVMDRFGDLIDWDENEYMMVPERLWPKVQQVAYDADGIGAENVDDGGAESPEHLGMTEGLSDDNSIWNQYGHYTKQDLMKEFPNITPQDAQSIVNYAEYGWSPHSDAQKFRNEVVKRIKIAQGQDGVMEGYSALDLWNMSPKEVIDLYDAGKITYDEFRAYQDLVIQGGPDEEDDFDYTDYTMRKGEQGVAEGGDPVKDVEAIRGAIRRMERELQDPNPHLDREAIKQRIAWEKRRLNLYRDVTDKEQGVAEANGGHAGSAKVRYTGGMHGTYEPTKIQASPQAHLDAAKYHDNEANTYVAAMNNPKADPKDTEWYKNIIQHHKNKADFHKRSAGQQGVAEDRPVDSDGYTVDQEDAGEYDYEGDQAKDQLQTIVVAARKLNGMLDDNENMPEWVQMKITKATDYLDTAADYIAANKAQAEPMSEAEPEKIGGRHNPEDFDDMVSRLKKLAGAGPMKTVYDPNTRRYKNIPTAQQPGNKK